MVNSYLKIDKNLNNIKITTNINNEKFDENIVKQDMKKLFKLQKRINKKTSINIITDLDLENFDNIDNQKLNLIASLKSCQIKDKNKRLEFIYMAACKYLDNEFKNNNICGFCEDICDGKRDIGKKNGCCQKFTDKILGLPILNRFEQCEYNKDKSCKADCLGCKLFCCDTVIKKGYNYTVFNVPLINYYFNLIQKIIIKVKVFTHKDEVLKLLRIFNF